jgi:hypothetical protein
VNRVYLMVEHVTYQRSFSYPAHSLVGGDSKIPTILYYDNNGLLKACGAEALDPGLTIAAEAEGWIKTEWSDTPQTMYEPRALY